MSCGWCQKPPEDGGSGDLPPVGHDELSRGTRNYKKTLLLRHHVSTEHKLHEANAQVRYMLLLLFQIFGGKAYQLKLTLLGEEIFPVEREVQGTSAWGIRKPGNKFSKVNRGSWGEGEE